MPEFVLVWVAIKHFFVTTGQIIWKRGHFVAVGSVKPAIAALDLHVISVPKAKKKPKKKSK